MCRGQRLADWSEVQTYSHQLAIPRESSSNITCGIWTGKRIHSWWRYCSGDSPAPYLPYNLEDPEAKIAESERQCRLMAAREPIFRLFFPNNSHRPADIREDKSKDQASRSGQISRNKDNKGQGDDYQPIPLPRYAD